MLFQQVSNFDAIQIVTIGGQDRESRNVNRYLYENPRFQLVAHFKTGQEALEKCPDLSPIIIIVDYFIPDMNCLTLAQTLMKLIPTSAIIIHCLLLQEEFRLEAQHKVGRNFLFKHYLRGTAHKAYVIKTIESIYNNWKPFSDELAAYLKEKNDSDDDQSPGK